ncbi:MAG: dihydrodipicolinate synthase family protein [Oscillospiraceae bacterium]|nr:dihydrodipicolinate synthase family protein [Oscillospiraceae bacterium]
MKNITNGVWVTMITPFTKDSKIDYSAVEALVEWYISKNVDGIFAVCQSSEMFFLSFEERFELAKFVIETVNKRVEVIVSGNTHDDADVQIKEARAFAELEPEAIVFLTNRLDIDKTLKGMPEETALGVYECPYPSKRLLTDSEIEYLVKSGRFVFLKDTSCDAEIMRRRAKMALGTPFKVYNANAATLYETLKFGYNGYCGVMGNFHPDLYAWLYWNLNDARAERVANFLSMMSVIECREYPLCAKYYLSLFEGLGINKLCRSRPDSHGPALAHELKALCEISRELREFIA